MTIAHATALLPRSGRLVLRDHQPTQDAEALHALARWATRFTPVVAPDLPDGLTLDVTGCQRLYGGDEKLASLVLESFRRLRLDVQVAVAPTAGGAWGAARFAVAERPGWRVIDEQELPEALTDLPTAALRVETSVVDALADVGIDRVGQLLDVPREQIAQRFGAGVLLRIDQAMGYAIELIEPVRIDSPPNVERRFTGPTTQYETIEQAVRDLVDELSAALLEREAGVRRLVLEVERLNRELRPETASESITLSRPSRDAKHLWAMLRPRVEKLHLGCGVERLTLIGRRTSPLPHEQERMDGTADDGDITPAAMTEAAGQLVDLLQSRLGPAAVLACEPVDTHIPEAAFRFRPANEGGLFNPGPSATGEFDGDRPTVLLDKPEPARVMLMQPEGPILSVQWRGRLHRIITVIGPERIGRRWWHFALTAYQPARDYYKLQDEIGQWLWVYRSLATGRWFIHGLWA